MNYFWLKKKAFLGSFVKNYIYITVLCFYSSRYSASIGQMAQSPTFELETDNIILKRYETEVGDISLNYIVEFSPEEIVYNKDYSGSVTLTAGEYLEVYPKIVTYGDYLFDLRSGIGQVSSNSFGLNELSVKDKVGFYVNAELEDGHSLYIDDVLLYYTCYEETSVDELELGSSVSFSLQNIEFSVKKSVFCEFDTIYHAYFSIGTLYFYDRTETYLGNFEYAPSSDFVLGDLAIDDKYDFDVALALENAHLLYINSVYCDVDASRELKIEEMDQSDAESVGLVDAKYLVHVNSSITMDELFNHSFSLNDVECKTNYALESGIGELNSLHADLQTTKYIGNVDIVANFGMFYTNQLLNGLRVEYSKSIINYVNIGSNESSNISLSELTIKDGIELVQGISTIGALSMPLRTMYAKDNYSVSIGGLEFETYMKFYNLNGLKVSDLDGLVFSDLMFN